MDGGVCFDHKGIAMKTRIACSIAVALGWMSLSMPFSLTAQATAAGSQALKVVNGTITSDVHSGVVYGPELDSALVARRDLMKEVLRDAPADSRSYALDDSTRTAILAAKPSAAALLEQDAVLTGELVASVADDFQHGTASTHYTLHTFDRDLDLSFVAVPSGIDRMVHSQVTVHGVNLDNIMVSDSLVRATPAEIAQCAPARSKAARSFASSADAAPATCSTTGTQHIAVLIVNFPGNTPAFPAGLDQAAYWQKVLTGPNPSVNGFWNEVSYGQTSATADVYGPFALSQAYDCNSTSAMQTAAIAAAAAAGTVDFTQYNRFVIVFPVSSCWFGGFANIGCQSATSTINQQYSVVWLPISSWYEPDDVNPQVWGATAHELGHNLGLNHANTLDFGSVPLGPLDFVASNPGLVTPGAPRAQDSASAASTPPIAAVNIEYGDTFSAMGYPWNNAGPYSAEHRSDLLAWIPKTDEADITSSGDYTLVPAEDSSGLRALHVFRDPTSGSWLWLEFHQPLGFYTPNNLAMATPPQSVITLTNGALIHYETGSLDPLHTYQLDMNPVAFSNNFEDGTFAPGSSWSDPYSLLTLTAGSQTSSSLGITVSYDTPCAAPSLSASELAAAGGTANLTISAPSTCSWTVSSNASWISFPGTTSGSGNATIPFDYAANTTTGQQNSYITAQRQSLPVVQDGPNVTIVGASPVMASGSAQSFVVTASDLAGVSDLSYVYFFIGNCEVQVRLTGTDTNSAYFWLWDTSSASVSEMGIAPGSNNSLSISGCTLYAQGSSVVFSGNQMILTIDLSFSAPLNGPYTLKVEVDTQTSGTNTFAGPMPVGIFTVNSVSAAATPIISPAGSTLTSPQSVTITDPTAGATIYYTTDGSGPTTHSTQYSGQFTVSQPETINALAIAPNYSQSLVASAAFTIATPVLSPNGGVFTWPQSASVTITDASPGVKIYYTTDGSWPTSTSAQYTVPITVSQSGWVQAIAVAPGVPPSSVAQAYFAIVAATPALSLKGGTFTSPQTVTITDATPGATIYYTTDGTWPTISSTQYTGQITVSQSEWLIAIAVAPGLSQSAGAEAYYSVNFPAALTSPTPGAVLTGSGATFQWTAGAGVTQYVLGIGSTGVGSYNLFNSTPIAATQASVTGLPTNGATLYARLYSMINGAWQYNDYTYTAAPTPVPAILTSPTPGSKLTGSGATFQWTTGTAVTQYVLGIGSTGVGSYNLFNSTPITATQASVTGLPTNGETLYARLYSWINGAWQYNDYTYSAAATPAVLTSPTPSSTLTSSSATFQWTAGTGVTQYVLGIGSTGVGSYNLFNSTPITATQVSVTGLPTNGTTLYARLYSMINGAWQYNDYTYSAAATPAVLTSPTPGSTLTSNSATFQWTAGTGVTQYVLGIGSTGVGSYNLFNSTPITATQASVTGLPTNGETLYARLYSWINGAWQYNDYTYSAAATPAVLTSPTPGSTLTSNSATFQWTAGTGVTQYVLGIGSTGVGSYNLFNSTPITATQASVTGLPTNGETLYARLYSWINGAWQYKDYTYTAQ